MVEGMKKNWVATGAKIVTMQGGANWKTEEHIVWRMWVWSRWLCKDYVVL